MFKTEESIHPCEWKGMENHLLRIQHAEFSYSFEVRYGTKCEDVWQNGWYMKEEILRSPSISLMASFLHLETYSPPFLFFMDWKAAQCGFHECASGFWVGSANRKPRQVAVEKTMQLRVCISPASSCSVIARCIPWLKEGRVANFTWFSLSTGSSNCLLLGSPVPCCY